MLVEKGKENIYYVNVAKVREDEKTNKDILIEFEDNYPDVLNGDNLTDILKAARAKKKG